MRAIAGTGSTSPEPGLRLQKVLARAGLGSRRSCELMVTEGRVTVNGQVAHIGQRADAARDHISIDGIPLPVRDGLVYYLLNKPTGVICTAADPQGRPSALDLVPSAPRVFTVGRLDVDSAGLIVVTNDGDLAHHLTHPAFGVEKEYVVEVEGALSRHAVSRLRRGVELDDGMTAPASVQLLRPDAARIVLHEGRKRQVRRMCEAVGHPVHTLVRTRVGPVSGPQLAPGQSRSLTTAEVMDLWEAASRSKPGPRSRAPAAPADR